MRAAAPGKLVIAGAYAVLEGAPAIVCAVDRHAYAYDGEGKSTREVEEALSRPTAIDVHELEAGGKKLGLGGSAAALVAALAFRAAQRGEAVSSPAVRRAIFERAREVHAQVQSGGSGVDVAASTFGGALAYTLDGFEAVSLPPGVHFAAFFSGMSARTSTLRERVNGLRARDQKTWTAKMAVLIEIAKKARAAVASGDARAFVDAIDASGAALAALGAASEAPIVPEAFATLGEAARREKAAFIPSGAGGGDVGVFVGMSPPSASFIKAAKRVETTLLKLALESRGVRIEQGTA